MRKLKLDELGRESLSSFKEKKKFPVSIVLDNIRSAMNVGSFFRTADAFAVRRIYLTGISATPPHPEINKTAIGATQSIEWRYEKDILDLVLELKAQNVFLIGIEQTTASIPLEKVEMKKDQEVALIFGNEVEGISETILPHLDLFVEIPQYGTKHSLNVAVCGGIVIHRFVSGLHQ